MTDGTAAAEVTDIRSAAGRLLSRLVWYDWLLLPVVAAWTVFRLIFKLGAFASTKQRLGLVPRRPAGAQGAVWIHAVSVGELASVRPVIAELKRLRPCCWVLLSTTQRHAVRLARADPGGADAVCELPWDLGPCVRAALHRARPDALALVECELWPKLIAQSAAAGTRVSMVNARLYPRDFPGYLRARTLFGPLLRLMSWIAAQSRADAERFLRLGAPAARVFLGGNTKFDAPSPMDPAGRAAALRQSLPMGSGPLLVLASTHDGEEAMFLDRLAPLQSRFPGLTVLIAPRHIERAGAIAAAARARRLRAVLRTAAAAGSPEPAQVVVLDTMGELPTACAAADVVFVGGSLVPRGGQNPVEPAIAAKPIVVGPHTGNFSEIVAAFVSAEAIVIAGSADEAVARIGELLADPDRRSQLGRRAADTVARNAGAAARLAGRIVESMEAGMVSVPGRAGGTLYPGAPRD